MLNVRIGYTLVAPGRDYQEHYSLFQTTYLSHSPSLAFAMIVLKHPSNRPRIKFEASVGTHCNVQFDLGFDAPVWHTGLGDGWVIGAS
jgi:hypothetical protein